MAKAATYSATTLASSPAITSAFSSILAGVVASGTTGIAPCTCTTNRRATTNSLEPLCFFLSYPASADIVSGKVDSGEHANGDRFCAHIHYSTLAIDGVGNVVFFPSRISIIGQ
ncbi:hypothetical protein PI126_g16629 [Phytophthora idaei]|nr:hypothetical protein PI126_g16629 [Phytophthora idaei]